MIHKELKNGDFKALIKSVKTESGKDLFGAEIYYKDFKFRHIFYGELNKQITIKRAEFIIHNTKAEINNEILFLTLRKENYFNTINLKPVNKILDFEVCQICGTERDTDFGNICTECDYIYNSDLDD